MKFLKIGGIIFGALLITTLGINASDVFNGNSGALLGQLISLEEGTCPVGMIEVSVGQAYSCIDIYEASADSVCPQAVPGNTSDTQQNLNETQCGAVSQKSARPWVYISREQAQVACARSGKRLPSAREWYVASLGTPDTKTSCNAYGASVVVTGRYEQCRSAVGIFDAVGNVWEWVSDDVIAGEYNGRMLPEEGYVQQVASDGTPVLTGNNPNELFGLDYGWIEHEGAYAVLRGGYFASKDDAGVYSFQAKTLPTAATGAIGFRCVL